jgi:hypothetical protein
MSGLDGQYTLTVDTRYGRDDNKVELWRDGRQLPDREALAVLADAAGVLEANIDNGPVAHLPEEGQPQ